MNITLNKLLDYINSNYERIILMEGTISYSEFISSLCSFIEDSHSVENRFIFDQFDILSVLLNNGDFKIKEQYDIVYSILKTNLDMQLDGLEKALPVSYDPYRVMSFYTKEECEYLDNLSKNINLDILIEKDKNRLLTVTKLLQPYIDLKTNYIDALEKLRQSNYFNENYNTKDIVEIIIALKKLGLSDIVCGNIEKILLNKLNKKIDVKDIKINFAKTNEKKEKLLTDKEYKELRTKIKKVYDSYNGKILVDLTYSEAIETGNMLYTLGYADSEIQRFFMNFNKNNYINMLDIYLYNYDKLKFYEEKCGYNLSILDEYYDEFLNTSDDDKKFWENEFKTLLINILHKIENHYEYEIQKSKKLSLDKKV